MATSLTRLQIDGLHGRNRTIDIPLRDNRLVLVGENGTGKSTVANLLYYTLTQQWRRIAEYRFNAIEVSTADETVRVTHEDAEALAAYRSGTIDFEFRTQYPPSLRREIAKMLASEPLFLDPEEEFLVERVAMMTRVSKERAKKILKDISDSQTRKVNRQLVEQIKQLESWDFGQFLYLPTYRRIEQDLKSIFRGIEIEEKIREFRDRFRKRERSTFIELIEFGMEDVERTIQARMIQIKERVRTSLGALTGTYLSEVIKGFQANPDLTTLRSIGKEEFQAMFDRIDEAILPHSDKQLLQAKIAEIADAHNYTIKAEDRVVAHFLSKLVLLYKDQQAYENDVRDFINICNLYLTEKEFVYDALKYEIYIRQTNSDDPIASREDKRLELKVLSSGEKQIVSLFSQMYLSGQKEFFVVIDEPELSLSVQWQQRFLPDIIKTNRCTGLVSVTHSPFIWENEFEAHVGALAEFTKPHC